MLIKANVYMIILYVKYAGMPYKSEKHYKGVKQFSIMAIYWTIAIIIKLVYYIGYIDDICNDPYDTEDDILSDLIFFT